MDVAYNSVCKLPMTIQRKAETSSTARQQHVSQTAICLTSDNITFMYVNITARFNQQAKANKQTNKQTKHTFNGPLSGTTRVSRYQKGKPIWILLKQETVSGSGISWAICKSAPHSKQITTPATHRSFFTGQMPFLPPDQ